VVDWVGNDGMSTSRRYRFMAESQLRGISASYERLCLGVAEDAEVLELIDTLPAAKRQPNLLLGAVRFLEGPIDSYAGFRSFVVGRWDELSATMLARRTQTNEAARCTALLLELAALPQPLALLEVGASAGLCLYPDRYAYRYDDRPVLGESPVLLACRTTGAAPVPHRLPHVVWRRGLDLNPLDVRDDDDVRWLRSLIWPEQTDRFEVFDKAVATARAEPVPVVRGDLTTDLARASADAPRQATLVVYHSAVLAYLDGDQRAMFRAALDELAAQRPTVWLSNEGPGVCVDIKAPPGPVPFVLGRDGVPLAFTSPHGDWVDWLAT
jgi:hypothetical protein